MFLFYIKLKIFKIKGVKFKVSKRINTTVCPKCRKKINVDDELELGNYEKVGRICFIYCPFDGQEIIISK